MANVAAGKNGQIGGAFRMKKKDKTTIVSLSEPNGATIFSARIAIPALIVSVLSLVVAITALGVTYFNISHNTKRTADYTQGILEELQSIQVYAGIHNGDNAFLSRIEANHGDEKTVQITFKNISGFRMDTIAAHVVLPQGLEYVPESTIVYNRTNPNGLPNADGIADGFIGLGGYNSFDDQGRGSGSVSFRVRVSDDGSLFVPGVNTFNLVCSVSGYIDGQLATDTYTAYATIDVIIE